MLPTPRTFSHIGLSVPNVDEAVKFYTEVLGFYTIMPPTDVTEDDSDIGVICTDVFGAGWGHLRIARLATADKIGFVLFEFDGNEAPQGNLSFRHHGMFHFAIQDPDLEGLLAKILAAGGKTADAGPRLFSRQIAVSHCLRLRPIRHCVRNLQPQLCADIFGGCLFFGKVTHLIFEQRTMTNESCHHSRLRH